MSDLPPGPELDRLVAEKVMGWAVTRPVHTVPEYIRFQTGPSVRGFRAPTREQAGWNPSTNIAHAWEVVEKLVGGTDRVVRTNTDEHGTMCRVIDGSGDGIASSAQETTPHAICLAALRAVGATDA